MYFILFEVTEMLLLYIIVKKKKWKTIQDWSGLSQWFTYYYIMDHKESQK